MSVYPPIRAPHEDARDTFQEKDYVPGMPYEDYLQTRHWQQTRNAALRRARWKCSRCPMQTTLQVHHKTYERIGCEEPGDLEVLCINCHEGVHIDEQRQIRGIYATVIRECLRVERFECMADLMAAAKDMCACRKIQYDPEKLSRAVQLLDTDRRGILDAPRPRFKPPPPSQLAQPIGREEAANILRALGIAVCLPSLPAAPLPKDNLERDHELANEIRQWAARGGV